MIHATIRKSKETLKGFELIGHAGSAPKGEDLVCCAVSVLSINTVNSLERFTSDNVLLSENEDDGRLSITIAGKPSKQADLLLRSFELGITELAKQYRSYISLDYTEV